MNKVENYFSENQQLSFPFTISELSGKKLEVSYSGNSISSDGGALLLREVDKKLGLIDKLAECIDDQRDQRYIDHQIATLLRQRTFQIGCGYEDGNDCNELRGDSVFKVCADRLPESEPDLGSQSTISRFENAPSRRELYRMAQVFIDQFIESYPTAPGMIILDCDDTDNTTYGAQQLSFFNTYYQDYCYMPLHIYEGISGKLITTILKPGRRSKHANVYAILKRVIAYLSKAWPKTLIIVRGDCHFCSHELMDSLVEKPNIHFVTGLTGNSKLKELVQPTIEVTQQLYEANKKPHKRYTSFEYQANSWQHPQLVIAKVEVNHRGTNIRYIVTDLRGYRPSQVYEKAFCARGSMELRIKDHKLYLHSDRSSCHSFKANQFRLFLHSAAYVLIHELRSTALKGTDFSKATIKTIQLKILKTAAWVKELKTKIKIELPKNFAHIAEQKSALQILSIPEY